MKSNDGSQSFFPLALAFYLCGDEEILFQAKRAVQVVAHVLQNLYEVETVKTDFKFEEIEAHASKMYDRLEPGTIKLGLYLAPEFRILAAWGSNPQNAEISYVRINERIVEMTDLDSLWDQYIARQLKQIDEAPGQEQISPIDDRESGTADDPQFKIGGTSDGVTVDPNLSGTPKSRKVFLAHGHAEEAKQTVARFLERLGLEVIILHELPNRSKTIIEKVEKYSDVDFAVVLLTPDDVGASKKNKKVLKKRSRQNVILELGYFIGKLGREHVCALYIKGVEIPSNFGGVLYVPYDKSGNWRSKLAKEIDAAGIGIDLKKAL